MSFFEFCKRTFAQCTGERFIKIPPNSMISYGESNYSKVMSDTYSHVFLSNRKKSTENSAIVYSFINLFCNSGGELNFPSTKITEIPNVIIKVQIYNSVPIYEIYSQKNTLTDKAILEMIKLEERLNNNKIVDVNEFIKQKISAIKKAHGISEAIKWSSSYMFNYDIKDLGWWYIYQLD